ncbi:HNH endonuclease [Bacillus mesophilum]|uniref:HNH endonuclease n=1 Tax=Bacillus mesophilum TaxID=1071718 RepID=A0A7V7UVN0_9BACI|nr:HNH endonuclease [Bacillus mesophilum]KAB2332931.1 HNH endonuclease [Bacillus mesophilum]
MCEETKYCSRCDQDKPIDVFYKANRSYCAECERAAASVRMREYGRTPRGKASMALQNARKTIKKNGYEVEDNLEVDDVLAVMEFFGNTCVYCDQEIAGTMSIDHVVPLSKGGGNTKANIVVACMPCNVKKHDRPIAERFSQEKQEEVERYSAFVDGEDIECESLSAEVKRLLSGLSKAVENFSSLPDVMLQKSGLRN